MKVIAVGTKVKVLAVGKLDSFSRRPMYKDIVGSIGTVTKELRTSKEWDKTGTMYYGDIRFNNFCGHGKPFTVPFICVRVSVVKEDE